MLKSAAVAYFGNQKKLAAAVRRANSTVSEWPDVIPLEHAFVLERLTDRKLKIDPALYPKLPPQARRPQ